MELTQAQAVTFRGKLDYVALIFLPYYSTLVESLDPPATMTFEDEDRQEILKACTVMVRLLDLSLACYPLTDSSALLYDADGNPLP